MMPEDEGGAGLWWAWWILRNTHLIKTGDQWGGGGLHQSNTEMTADNENRNRFKFWELWDDWLTETVAETNWLIEVQCPQLADWVWRWGESEEDCTQNSISWLNFPLVSYVYRSQNIVWWNVMSPVLNWGFYVLQYFPFFSILGKVTYCSLMTWMMCLCLYVDSSPTIPASAVCRSFFVSFIFPFSTCWNSFCMWSTLCHE